jgi:hypothetical protein
MEPHRHCCHTIIRFWDSFSPQLKKKEKKHGNEGGIWASSSCFIRLERSKESIVLIPRRLDSK